MMDEATVDGSRSRMVAAVLLAAVAGPAASRIVSQASESVVGGIGSQIATLGDTGGPSATMVWADVALSVVACVLLCIFAMRAAWPAVGLLGLGYALLIGSAFVMTPGVLVVVALALAAFALTAFGRAIVVVGVLRCFRHNTSGLPAVVFIGSLMARSLEFAAESAHGAILRAAVMRGGSSSGLGLVYVALGGVLTPMLVAGIVWRLCSEACTGRPVALYAAAGACAWVWPWPLTASWVTFGALKLGVAWLTVFALSTRALRREAGEAMMPRSMVDMTCITLVWAACIAVGYAVGGSLGGVVASAFAIALTMMYVGARAKWSCGGAGRARIGIWVIIALGAGVVSPGGLVSLCSFLSTHTQLDAAILIGVVWLVPAWAHLTSWALRDSLQRAGLLWMRTVFLATAWASAVGITGTVLWYVSSNSGTAF